ncbi:MAG: hypothetical protein D6797_03600 [Bdellovibrio sp.]|nr:MAG: hypothetical protein D6797_03600 [Bdellovibrio sp.]
MTTLKRGFFFLFLIGSVVSFAKTYHFRTLRLLDKDTFQKAIEKRIAKANRIVQSSKEESPQEAIEVLRDALKFALTRPNYDNLLDNNLNLIRLELKKHNAFEDTLSSVISEAIYILKKSKNTTKKASSLFLLTNFMSEFQVDIRKNKEIRSLFKKIQKAHIKIDHKTASLLRQNMYSLPPPSETAKAVLKKWLKRQKDR